MQLAKFIQKVFILRYQEEVAPLVAALRDEGFDQIELVSRNYTELEQSYARSYRCLMGHCDAWQRAASEPGYSLILEADFVPCRGFGRMKPPIPVNSTGPVWGWLYSSAQRVYQYDGEFIIGHSGAPVATLINAPAASIVSGFVEEENKYRHPSEYSLWDTYVRTYAAYNGVTTYLPIRSYGEHGGLANPEHRLHKVNPCHQADVLIAPLHFLPPYAKHSRLSYKVIRAKAYLRAWARLFAFRYVEIGTLKNTDFSIKVKLRLMWLGLKRLIPIIPL